MKRIGLLLLLVFLGSSGFSQFYRGTKQNFGKSRIQTGNYLWRFFSDAEFEVYYYSQSQALPQRMYDLAKEEYERMVDVFEFRPEGKIQLIVFESYSDFKQNNEGYSMEGESSAGGGTMVTGNKIFLYGTGNRSVTQEQVRRELSRVFLNQLLYGTTLKEMVKNHALLSFPDWYVAGLTEYFANSFDAEKLNLIRDKVYSGRFQKIGKWEESESVLAGYALWTFVVEKYGEGVVPGIIFVSRIQRNIESGFMMVLGLDLKALNEAVLNHYKEKFAEGEENRESMDPKEKRFEKSRRQLVDAKLSPNGKTLAMSSYEMGQIRIYLLDLNTGKKTKIDKSFHKINRVQHPAFPVLAWHPKGKILSYAMDQNNEVFWYSYNINSKKTERKLIRGVDEVLAADYSPDGNKIVLSASKNGLSDLYLYYPSNTRVQALNTDIYDDLEPRFSASGEWIYFISDRNNDTLVMGGAPQKRYDVFAMETDGGSAVLRRITNSPLANESQVTPLGNKDVLFISDRAGIRNQYWGKNDSSIAFIDTTIHYRFFTTVQPLSNYKRDLLKQDFSISKNRWLGLSFQDGAYVLDHKKRDELAYAEVFNSYLGEVKQVESVEFGNGEGDVDVRSEETIEGERLAVFPKEKRDVFVLFEDRPIEETNSDTTTSLFSRFLGADKEQRSAFPYDENFTNAFVESRIDNAFANEFYQPFTGPESVNPGLSGYMRFGLADLFENYSIVGGLRLSGNFNSNDYFLRFENNKKKLDKSFTFARNALRGTTEISLVQIYTHSGIAAFKWPLSEVVYVKGSAVYSRSRFIALSTDVLNLTQPDAFQSITGLKFETVFDNVLRLGENLMQGGRIKLFGESYILPSENNESMYVVGFDARHYTKVHRKIIWANRLAASSSFGQSKVIYYLGGVDNSLFPKVDLATGIDFNNGYRYQSLVSPMRGFFNNARNGNNFVALSSEMRVPIIRYLANHPLKSNFLENFQVIAFTDVGTAWTGKNPYDKRNFFNNQVFDQKPLRVTIKSQREPMVYGYGFGLRSTLFGYFVRADWAWGVDDGIRLPRVFYISLNLDF